MRIADRKYKIFLLLGLSGILTGLTLVFPQIGFLEWVSLVPMALALFAIADDERVKLRHIYLYGLYFFGIFYVVCFHWFVNLYPFEFINGMTKPAALGIVLLGVFGLSLLQGFIAAVAFSLAALLFRTPVLKKYAFLRPIFMGGIWAVLEWVHTLGWWGVPWGRLPIGQTEYLVGAQTASLFGSYFVTFIIVVVNFYVAQLISACFIKERAERILKIKIFSAVICGILLFQYGAGLVIWFSSGRSEVGNEVTVGAVQGNFPSGEKWNPDTEERTLSIYRQYTLEAARDGADIIVWPETAFPWTVKEGSGRHKFIADIAKEADATILVGCFTFDGEGREYNSIIYVTPDGEYGKTVYAKRHLVPFGEFVPLGSFIETVFPPLANLIMSGSDLAEGDGANLFSLKEGAVGSLICFDSIYEDATLESVRSGAQLICLSTNDSWFTDSAALYMHRAQGQLRAIECSRYVVRSANTGLTCIINNRGEVVNEVDPHVSASLTGEIEMRSGRTLYSYIGNAFIYLWLTIIAVFVVAAILFEHKSKNV